MIESWEDVKLTCFHGVKEEIDYHPCPECQELAREQGLSSKQTWIYIKKPRRKKCTYQQMR